MAILLYDENGFSGKIWKISFSAKRDVLSLCVVEGTAAFTVGVLGVTGWGWLFSPTGVQHLTAHELMCLSIQLLSRCTALVTS